MAISLPPKERPARGGFIDGLVGRLTGGRAGRVGRVRRTNAETERGGPGFTVYGGYVTSRERNARVSGLEKYRTFSEIIADTAMVASGVRYFLNLCSKSEWRVRPVDVSDEAKAKAEFVDRMLRTMTTPWHQVVRQAAMHRFYGFTVQEWTASRNDDGDIVIQHVESRPQFTIERFDTDVSGRVHGFIQRIPQTNEEVYLPRSKVVYSCDNSFTDDPRGLGILRHIVRPVRQLRDYERLEQTGYETDMRGIPIARGPLGEIQSAVATNRITREAGDSMIKPLVDFIKNHIRGADSGLVLDSAVYSGRGENETPIKAEKYSVDLLSGGSYGHKEIAESIERINREIARVLGVEQLLLGADSAGSLALSRDKSQAFFMVVNAALTELRDSFQKDLIDPVWAMNGFDDDLKPLLTFESVEFKDPEQISRVVKDLATSGVAIDPEDDLVDELLDVVGLSGINLAIREERKEERIRNARMGLDENGFPLPGGVPGGGGGASGGKDPASLSGNLPGVDPGGSADDALRAEQGRAAASRARATKG